MTIRNTLLAALGLLLFCSPALAQEEGLLYHSIRVTDEYGEELDITSMTIYVPGTTTAAVIYKDPDLNHQMTNPVTTTSTNTTISGGRVSWWGPDGWGYSVTADGMTQVSSTSRTLSSNVGRITMFTVSITDAELAALAGLESNANTLPYFTGSGTAALVPFSPWAQVMLQALDANDLLGYVSTEDDLFAINWPIEITSGSNTIRLDVLEGKSHDYPGIWFDANDPNERNYSLMQDTRYGTLLNSDGNSVTELRIRNLPIVVVDANGIGVKTGHTHAGNAIDVVGDVNATGVFLSKEGATAKTAAYSVKASEAGSYFTNTGATKAITFALPPAVVGLEYTFVRTADANTITVDPNGSELFYGNAAGHYTKLNSAGATLTIRCIEAGKWMIKESYGTIEEE